MTELFAALPEVYVAVAIDGNAELPRQRMMTAAFAFRAQVAQNAYNLLCTDCVGSGQLADGAISAAKLGESCQEGEVLKSIGGVWSCAPDADTAYVAGDGVAIDAGTVSITSANCTTGQVLKRNAANDGWECANDAGAAGSVTSLRWCDGFCGDRRGHRVRESADRHYARGRAVRAVRQRDRQGHWHQSVGQHRLRDR